MKKSYVLSMDERLTLRFDFCKKHLSGCSRDYGIYYSIATLFSFYSDSTAFKVVEKQLKDFCELASDKRFAELGTRIYNKKFAASSGHIAPNLTLPDITNQNISLSDFKGKTVYMEFTGSWCIFCRKEIPHLIELQKKFKDNPDIEFVSIWLESAENPSDTWSSYVHGTGLRGIHLYSAAQFNGKAPKLYQVEGTPIFMIIDKYGKIVSSNAKRPGEDGIYEDLIRTAGN
ncbi:MAG: TlpA family protein disulfide reductase [Ignavibacteriae bacterium]|nr:TlpA family protein disulfide reductase [Ignavibacteriota bacterium]